MSANVEHVWKHADGLAVVEGDQRVVTLDLTHPDRPPLGMPGAAADVWRAIDGRRTGAEVVAEIATLWGTTAHRIHDDIDRLLDRLAEAGLVVRTDVLTAGRALASASAAPV